jgi:dTDP-4-dehydrorhamnose reductase
VDYYPEHLHGGNGRHAYVDTEAIRVRHDERFGLQMLFTEAWRRFGIPMALTEAYLSCTEDEQVRWLKHVCGDIDAVRHQGVDVRSIAFWALLGEFGWNKLVTSIGDAEYEPGAFDIRHEPIRETLTATFIREFTRGVRQEEEWIKQPGWWQREDRFHIKSSLQTM